MKRWVKIRGLEKEVNGKTWESDSLLRIGRLDTLEVVLAYNGISRRHAEIRLSDQGWHLKDLGSTNGTFLNGIPIRSGEPRLHKGDRIQCGKITFIVDQLEDGIEQLEDDEHDAHALSHDSYARTHMSFANEEEFQQWQREIADYRRQNPNVP